MTRQVARRFHGAADPAAGLILRETGNAQVNTVMQ